MITDFEDSCRNQPSVSSKKLDLKINKDFLVLQPDKQSERINKLAQNCVTFFDQYRAPLNKKELARRLRNVLTRYQRETLSRWGYRYVFNDFKFHRTLTGKHQKHMLMNFYPTWRRKLSWFLKTAKLLEI